MITIQSNEILEFNYIRSRFVETKAEKFFCIGCMYNSEGNCSKRFKKVLGDFDELFLCRKYTKNIINGKYFVKRFILINIFKLR